MAMDDEEPRLLLKALGSIPEEDRDRVLAWMLARLPPAGETALLTSALPDPATMRQRSKQVALGERGFQVVPMRFTSDELARLRAWSEEHGFSMAAVVRGLVSRFLDGQPDAGPKTQQGGSAEAEPP
jgi:hypothetical protein